MSVYRYVRLDVFSNQPFTGIQLAMFPDAAGIDERRMQRIANEMALPETTFVFPPAAPGTAARVRIFTPTRELPMAGSPTIGTVFALAGSGRLRASADKTVLGLGIGPITVGLEWGQNALRFAWMTQPIPTFGPSSPTALRLPRQSACNRATLQTETCRCKSRPPEFHFCMFRCVRARRSMRHPSSVGDCARYSVRGSRRAPCICILVPAGGR